MHNKIIVSELIKSGVRHFLINTKCSCTPIALAISKEPLADITTHFDERGLAFHGIGIAKATNLPSCLVCTSNASIFNLYPAIVEAKLSNIPLIILLTELLFDTTVFGKHLKFETNIVIKNSLTHYDDIAAIIDHSVYMSLNPPAGPILINCIIQDSLYPLNKNENYDIKNENKPLPKTKYYFYDKILHDDEINYLANELSLHEKGIIIVGERQISRLEESIFSLAIKLQWPIFADIQSQLRHVGKDSTIINFYNQIIQTTSLENKINPDIILHLGGNIVSETLLKWLKQLTLKKYYQVTNFSHTTDLCNLVSDKIEMNQNLFCSKISKILKWKTPNLWLSFWKAKSLNLEEIIDTSLNEQDTLSEISVIHGISSRINEDISIFFGNNAPIKHANNFFFPNEKIGQLFANCGSCEVEGSIALSIGVAKGIKNKVVVVVDYLSFLQDINSLAILHKNKTPITFIVLNNFTDELPQFQLTSKYSITIKKIAEGFNIQHFCSKSKKDFLNIFEECIKINYSNIIEVISSNEVNVKFNKEIENYIKNQLIDNKKNKIFYVTS